MTSWLPDQALLGMVHVSALPGTPAQRDPLDTVAARAADEAALLAEAGFDAIILENTHDVPYLRRDVGPEIVAGMTRVGRAVRDAVEVPLGVQVLAGANRAAIAVALAIGAGFVRAEGFVFPAVADEGLMEEADAGPLLRYRRAIGAAGVRILADIKKKHSAHAITADLGVGEMAAAAEFSGADGVVVTGTATGEPTCPGDLAAARAGTGLPLLVGSGVEPAAVAGLLEHADGLIVGSWYKRDGHWRGPPDPARVDELVSAFRSARGR